MNFCTTQAPSWLLVQIEELWLATIVNKHKALGAKKGSGIFFILFNFLM